MDNNDKIRLFLVDDDAVYLKLLEIDFLEKTNFIISTFPTGEICIKNLSNNPDVVILDYHLDGINKNAMNGLKTLNKIKSFNPGIPVVMLSAQDKIDVAVNCMRNNAFDYVMKSETAFLRLQKIIETILSHNKMEKELNWYMDRLS